ncbi:hypothetical protein CDIK_2227 [Cucumispora dikerogammari]|nr:hypothetical protein CDIK_2227 [Cucumispora dikerogammari]
MDQTGANLHYSRNYGYSPKNSKAIKVVKANRKQNISSLVVIKKTRVLTFETKDGAFKGDSFIIFIKNSLKPHFDSNPNDILAINNCSFHNIRDVIEELKLWDINHRFLPPYSPQLNPIEEYFSHFKAKFTAREQGFTNSNELKQRIFNILT